MRPFPTFRSDCNELFISCCNCKGKFRGCCCEECMSAPRLLRPAKEDGGHYGQVWMMIAASVRFLSGNPSFHICIELGFCIPMHVFLIIICIPTYLVGQLRPRGGGSLCGPCYGDGAVPEPWKPRETCPKAGSGPGSETAAGGGEGQAQGHGGWVSGCVAAKSEFQLTVTLLHRTPGRMFFFQNVPNTIPVYHTDEGGHVQA